MTMQNPYGFWSNKDHQTGGYCQTLMKNDLLEFDWLKIIIFLLRKG